MVVPAAVGASTSKKVGTGGMISPIAIHIASGSCAHAALIYSCADAFRTRDEFRILGDLTGTLPKHVSQNQHLSLPLALSYDEAVFGLSRGLFRAVADTPVDYSPAPDAADDFRAQRGLDQDRQVEDAVRHQLTERERRVKKGRKRPRSSEEVEEVVPRQDDAGKHEDKRQRVSLFTRVVSQLRAVGHFVAPKLVAQPEWGGEDDTPMGGQVDEELRKRREEQVALERGRKEAMRKRLEVQARSTALVITATEARGDERGGAGARGAGVLRAPKGVSETKLRCRAAVFADLHDRGYVLSCGAKFGADFLAYASHPQLVHAALAVVVVEKDEQVAPIDVVALGRLGDATKKRTVLAFHDGDAVRYVGVQWEETLP